MSEVKPVAIDRPAASSDELLIRRPVDRRSIAVDSISLASMLAFWARRAEMLVLMTDIDEKLPCGGCSVVGAGRPAMAGLRLPGPPLLDLRATGMRHV